MPYSSGPRVIPHPLPEVSSLMVEIATPKPYIFMIRVNRQIKCPHDLKSWGPGHPHPLPEVFLRITHISETILSILTKLCPNVPWVILFQSFVRYDWGPKRGPKWLIILIFKNLLLVNQQCQKIDTWHITLINLENRNPVWPNDFDLQLGCCISALSWFRANQSLRFLLNAACLVEKQQIPIVSLIYRAVLVEQPMGIWKRLNRNSTWIVIGWSHPTLHPPPPPPKGLGGSMS